MILDNTLVILADLGELKVYRVKKSEAILSNEMKESYALDLIQDLGYIDAHQKVSDLVSDSKGSFGGSNTDEHNLEIERKKRSLKEIAKDINSVIEHEKPKQLFLAFSGDSLSQLVEQLNQNTKAILTKTVASNLVKTDKSKVLSHFA